MKETSFVDFTLIDIGIILVVLISIVIGLFRGFVKEALSIVVWTLSVIIAMKFYEDFTHYFIGITDNVTLRSGMSIGVIFIVCLISGSIISHLISVLVKSTGLSGTDRLLGIIFGLLRGGLIAAVIVLIVNYTEFSKNKMWQDSFLTKQIQPMSKWLESFIPEKVINKVNSTTKDN
tara:strand:- start:8153 stop:8680 length:528 start_codon:yes stop_codon:yes gene_type:complete